VSAFGGLWDEEGWLPTAQQLAAQGILQGSMAYKYARRAAEQGVDPDLAAQYGTTLSTAKFAFWLYTPVTGFLALCALGSANTILMIWALGQGLLLALLYSRMRSYERTDPSKRLRYGIPTGAVILGTIAWFLVAIVGFLSLFMGPITYNKGPVQQAPPTTVSQPSAASYQ
jgi:hypothetical protein